MAQSILSLIASNADCLTFSKTIIVFAQVHQPMELAFLANMDAKPALAILASSAFLLLSEIPQTLLVFALLEEAVYFTVMNVRRILPVADSSKVARSV